LCESLHVTLNMLAEQHSAPPRGQLAGILVSIFSHEGEEGRELPKLTQGALAAMAGISRQTTAKVLHEFRALGLVQMQYGKMRPLDLGRLQEIARL
jgi:CRP-like cAMP-binding protein